MELQDFDIVFPKHTHTHSVTHFPGILTSTENDEKKSRRSGLEECMGWDLNVAVVFRGYEAERRFILTS
jgi:hypothetical protein